MAWYGSSNAHKEHLERSMGRGSLVFVTIIQVLLLQYNTVWGEGCTVTDICKKNSGMLNIL